MGRHRMLMAAACALGLLFTLSGCVKLDMDVTVKANDTIEGTIILAVDKRLLAASGQSEAQLRDQLEKQGPFPASERPKKGKFNQHAYDKDGKVGQAYVFSGVPLSEFGNTTDGLKITHKGDRYFVTGRIDLSSGSAADPQTQALAKKFGSDPELRIKLTFPGEVLKSNGKISGRSVTWSPKLGQVTELTAEARATAVIPMLLAIVGGVVGLLLVIGLIVLILVLRRRRRARAAYATGAGYGGGDYGQQYDPQAGYDPAYQGGYGGAPPAHPGYAGQSPWQAHPGGHDGSGGYSAPPAGPPAGYSEPSPWQPGGQQPRPPWQSVQQPAPPSWQPGGPDTVPPAPGEDQPSPQERTQRLPLVDPTQPARPDEPGQR